MEAALYGPGGYYTEHPALGGPGGDYFTSPELHPVFGALLGRQVAEVWEALDRPESFDLVEAGPGSGALCRDLLGWARYEAPDFAAAIRYVLVESSEPLRRQQRKLLEAAGLLDGRVEWEARSALGPDRSVVGCILANELMDAFPVHLVTVRDGRLLERYVALDAEGRLVFLDDAPSTPALPAYFDALGLRPGEGCLAEVNLRAPVWMADVAGSLARGALLILDYGYPAERLYAPERRYGTLLCYRRHGLGSDPLAHVGEQDITSHVDFTSLMRAGEAAGLTTLGLTNQAAFLNNLGLRRYLRLLAAHRLPAVEHDANQRAMLALIDPDGLGAVQVLIQARDVPSFRPSGLGLSPPPAEPGWLPVLGPGQMRLPGPLELEGFGDIEAQWRELWGGRDEPAG